MPDRGHAATRQLPGETPFVSALGRFEQELQRAQSGRPMPVTFHVEDTPVHFMTGNEFDGRFLDDLAGRFPNTGEQRGEGRFQFPVQPVLRQLDHAGMVGTGLLGCQRQRPSTPRAGQILPGHAAIRGRAWPGSGARKCRFCPKNGDFWPFLPTSDGEITVEIFREIVKVFSRQSSDVRGFLKVWERLASSR